MNYLTQIDIAPNGKFSGPGTTGLLADPGNGIDIFARFVSSAIGLITIIAIVWFVFILFTGAISFITSGGDKASIESAKKKILSGLIGLVVVVSGLFILNMIGQIIGIENILNLSELFDKITK